MTEFMNTRAWIVGAIMFLYWTIEEIISIVIIKDILKISDAKLYKSELDIWITKFVSGAVSCALPFMWINGIITVCSICLQSIACI